VYPRFLPLLLTGTVMLVGSAAGAQTIDHGGLVLAPQGISAEPFTRQGRKWGDVHPSYPQAPMPGGVVTYSFVPDGVSLAVETHESNVSITALPAFDACFLREIRAAFKAWSAVADIQFVEVVDSGDAFNAPGSAGDIRIGAHVIDGPGGQLGHSFYPPPNGDSAAGDLHFDSEEPWSCTPDPGRLDLGVVVAHQIGHSIGLADEHWVAALMNPDYLPPRSAPFVDDVRGASAIYGVSPEKPKGNDLVMTFGALGTWTLSAGYGWAHAHEVSPERLVSGDLDGNGTADVIADFGAAGSWALSMFGSQPSGGPPFWHRLHDADVNHMVALNADGRRDGNAGGDEIVVDLPGNGIWKSHYRSPLGFSWSRLHVLNATRMVAGNFDGLEGDDLLVEFPGQGLWIYANDRDWTQLHVQNSTAIVAGDFNGDGADDLVVDFPGQGLWMYSRIDDWQFVHALPSTHLASGDIDGDGSDDLVVDFGAPHGIWIAGRRGAWSRLHQLGAESVTLGDLDGNGQDEVVVDFGDYFGVWAFLNDLDWIQIHTLSPGQMAFGHQY